MRRRELVPTNPATLERRTNQDGSRVGLPCEGLFEAQFQRDLVENLTGLSASPSDGEDAEGAGGEQSEAGGLGGGGGRGIRSDGEAEVKRWSEGWEEAGSLKLIGSRNKGDIEGSLVLRVRKLCGHYIPAIGYEAIQIGDA
jgi:hypothetical protein